MSEDDKPAKPEPHKRSLSSAQAVVLVPHGSAGSQTIFGITLLKEGFRLDNCVFEYLEFYQSNLEDAVKRAWELMRRHSVADVFIMIPESHSEATANFAIRLSEAISRSGISIRVRGLKDQEVDALC